MRFKVIRFVDGTAKLAGFAANETEATTILCEPVTSGYVKPEGHGCFYAVSAEAQRAAMNAPKFTPQVPRLTVPK